MKKKKKKRRAHFRIAATLAIQCPRRYFHSYLKETKKNQQSILKCILIFTSLYMLDLRQLAIKLPNIKFQLSQIVYNQKKAKMGLRHTR